MKRFRRWMASALALAIAAGTSVSFCSAQPAPTPFAEFHIDAAGMDAPERTISLARYTPDEEGRLQLAGTEELLCRLNRVTRDAGLFIQSKEEGVWVTVDYLTDINGDGVYEFLDDSEHPAWDVMDAQSGLGPAGEVIPALVSTQLYILSPELLVQRGELAARARSAGGDASLDLEGEEVRQEFPLCLITLRRTDPADGQDYEQSYYLQIYDDVLIPFDITPEHPYYDAVLFGLAQGYFGGVGGGLFCPDDLLNRAQLAQVLWKMSGSLQSEACGFSDVPEGEWYCPAVSWCQRAGLINGYGDNTFHPDDQLTREQLMAILRRYAEYTDSSLRSTANMSRFADQGDISSWAYNSVRWAVTNQILVPSEDNMLYPQAVVSRAELADALYRYDRHLGLRNLW